MSDVPAPPADTAAFAVVSFFSHIARFGEVRDSSRVFGSLLGAANATGGKGLFALLTGIGYQAGSDQPAYNRVCLAFARISGDLAVEAQAQRGAQRQNTLIGACSFAQMANWAAPRAADGYPIDKFNELMPGLYMPIALLATDKAAAMASNGRQLAGLPVGQPKTAEQAPYYAQVARSAAAALQRMALSRA